MYLGSGDILKLAIKKYGRENFERRNVAYYSSSLGYNLAPGGQGGNLGEEAIKKMSRTLRGRVSPKKGILLSEETKQKISNSLTLGYENGRINTKPMLGKRHSVETRRKISAANTDPPKEIRRKMSESHMGHFVSEETRRKISEGHVGKIVSLETRNKLRLINLGKKHSEKTKQKMKSAWERRKERER